MNNIRPNALVIILKDDSLLVQKGSDQKTGEIFCRLLGGGIELGESSNQTLKREIKEELNATILNEKLLGVIENIFEFNGKKGHEITFLYQGDLAEKNLYSQNKIKIVDKNDKYAEWVAVSKIKNGNITLYPKEASKYL
jgi:ADP-ribose pyrophosphatase YjhB (NUDIX family)